MSCSLWLVAHRLLRHRSLRLWVVITFRIQLHLCVPLTTELPRPARSMSRIRALPDIQDVPNDDTDPYIFEPAIKEVIEHLCEGPELDQDIFSSHNMSGLLLSARKRVISRLLNFFIRSDSHRSITRRIRV